MSVAGSGIGIRPTDLERLFEPFHRLDNPLAREAGRAGRIWAESRENQGSTFEFTLPLTPVAVAGAEE